MEIRPDEISRIIKDKLIRRQIDAGPEETGEVISVGDMIVSIYGLSGVMVGELVQFQSDLFGIVLNLEEDSVKVAVLGDDEEIKEGDQVKRTKQIASVPAGESVLGRVVNALGITIDGLGSIENEKMMPVERKAPGIIQRQSVKQSLHTGIKAIDAIVPIGLGQRELIIGDRQIGKTALALDAIIAQKKSGVKCIYVAIGQKSSSVARIVDKLKTLSAMDYTIVVAANAADPAPLRYLAPYAGMAIAEYFRDKGEHALIVFDDLSKHAESYRQLSLLLRRPPGREAYPGDVFYLHSRLLERAGALSEELGGGSITALPIVETLGGDISAYIPTNVISITDGQIYLERELFNAGFRPAINIGLSVSRIGGSAQVSAMKQVTKNLRLDLAQYRDLKAFAEFGAELDRSASLQIKRGEVLNEILKQPQYKPLLLSEEIAELFVGTSCIIDDLNAHDVDKYLTAYLGYLKEKSSPLMNELETKKTIDESIKNGLLMAAKKVREKFV